MTPELTAFQDDARCPRCGSGRLLRRKVRIERPALLRDGAPLALWWRARRSRGALAVERRVYRCEVCGWGWRVDRLANE